MLDLEQLSIYAQFGSFGIYKNMRHIRLFEAFVGNPTPPPAAWKTFVTSLKSKGFTEAEPEVTCGSFPATWYEISKGTSKDPSHYYVMYSPNNGLDQQKLQYRGTDITKTLEKDGEKQWGREYLFEREFPLGANKELGEYLTWLDQQIPKS